MTDTTDPKQDIREALRQLAKAPASPSATRRIAGLLEEIEASLAAGATLKEVRDTLASNGFALSERAFTSALYRARKQKKGGRKEGGRPSKAQHTPSASVLPATPTPTPAPLGVDVSGLNFRDAGERVADRFVGSHDSGLIKRLKEKEQKK